MTPNVGGWISAKGRTLSAVADFDNFVEVGLRLSVVVRRNLNQSASRFLQALQRIHVGLQQQPERVLDRAESAPRLMRDSSYEVIDPTGDLGNDLDYYIYELARLRDVGESIIEVFEDPQQLVTAQEAFGAAIPKLAVIRNPITHQTTTRSSTRLLGSVRRSSSSQTAASRSWSTHDTSSTTQR